MQSAFSINIPNTNKMKKLFKDLKKDDYVLSEDQGKLFLCKVIDIQPITDSNYLEVTVKWHDGAFKFKAWPESRYSTRGDFTAIGEINIGY